MQAPSILWEKQAGVIEEGFKIAWWCFLLGSGGWLQAPWATQPGCDTGAHPCTGMGRQGARREEGISGKLRVRQNLPIPVLPQQR